MRRTIAAPLVLLLCLTASAQIAVTNIHSGTTIRYPVLLLRGTAEGAGTVNVRSLQNKRVDGNTTWPVERGLFVSLVELVPGENTVRLTCGAHRAALNITYRQSTSEYRYNVVWCVGADGDGTYQTPYAHDKQDFRDKLDIAAKLMQTFTAERINDVTGERKTFNLEFDKDGKVMVRVLQCPKTADEICKGGDLYGHIYGWVKQKFPSAKQKNIVVMAFTRLDPATGKVRGHTALGGGDLALFGSPGLFAWPDSLQAIRDVFADATPVDGTKVDDDSAGRSTVWGIVATTIGATLHETGHTLGLPHVTDGRDIMSRGFDQFNQFFCLTQPPVKGGSRSTPCGPETASYFCPFFSGELAESRWLQPDGVEFKDGSPTVHLDADGKQVVFESPFGLGFVGAHLYRDGELKKAWAKSLKDAPKRFAVSVDVIEAAVGKSGFQAVAFDTQGNEGTLGYLPAALTHWLICGPFRAQGGSVFDTDFIGEAAVQPKAGLISAGHAWKAVKASQIVDIAAELGAADNAAAYLAITVRSPSERDAKLKLGSDDGVKVWVNGSVVHSNNAARGLEIDNDDVPIHIKAGANLILVKVTNGGDAWAFTGRITGTDNQPLPDLTESLP